MLRKSGTVLAALPPPLCGFLRFFVFWLSSAEVVSNCNRVLFFFRVQSIADHNIFSLVGPRRCLKTTTTSYTTTATIVCNDSAAQREERQRHIKLHMQLLQHASTCEDRNCQSKNCSRMKVSLLYSIWYLKRVNTRDRSISQLAKMSLDP